MRLSILAPLVLVASCGERLKNCESLRYQVVSPEYISTLEAKPVPNVEKLAEKKQVIASCLAHNPVEPNLILSDDKIRVNQVYTREDLEVFRISYERFADIDLLIEMDGTRVVKLNALRI
jgi:hypothetical protein